MSIPFEIVISELFRGMELGNVTKVQSYVNYNHKRVIRVITEDDTYIVLENDITSRCQSILEEIKNIFKEGKV